MTRTEQIAVSAPDGTPITVDVIGHGRPLVIVHGSIGLAADWHEVAHALGDEMTVYAVNRRGHGPSPDGPDYSFAHEVEDLAAVMDVAGPDAALFGHSFGGALALAYASYEPPAALIAYEPGIRLDEPIGGEAVPHVEEALSAGNQEDGLRMGMRMFAGFSEGTIAAAGQSPTWPQQVAMARTWPREMRGLDELDVSPERFARITSPTLLLRGTESPMWLQETTERQSRIIPGARLEDLPGQGHGANETAPQDVAETVRTFLRDHPRRQD